jgi:hypothetical protein
MLQNHQVSTNFIVRIPSRSAGNRLNPTQLPSASSLAGPSNPSNGGLLPDSALPVLPMSTIQQRPSIPSEKDPSFDLWNGMTMTGNLEFFSMEPFKVVCVIGSVTIANNSSVNYSFSFK